MTKENRWTSHTVSKISTKETKRVKKLCISFDPSLTRSMQASYARRVGRVFEICAVDPKNKGMVRKVVNHLFFKKHEKPHHHIFVDFGPEDKKHRDVLIYGPTTLESAMKILLGY